MAELPVTVNLDAYEGDDWFQTFRFKEDTTPVDLSSAQVRSECRGPGAALFEMPTNLGNASGGEVTLMLPEGIKAGSYYYDVQVTLSGQITTWVTGKLNVKPEVTVS
jgi:hypothetical protein